MGLLSVYHVCSFHVRVSRMKMKAGSKIPQNFNGYSARLETSPSQHCSSVDCCTDSRTTTSSESHVIYLLDRLIVLGSLHPQRNPTMIMILLIVTKRQVVRNMVATHNMDCRISPSPFSRGCSSKIERMRFAAFWERGVTEHKKGKGWLNLNKLVQYSYHYHEMPQLKEITYPMRPDTYSCRGSMSAPEASLDLAMLNTATDMAIATYKPLSASSFPGQILYAR